MTRISSIRKRTVVSSRPVPSGKTCQLSVLDPIMEKNNVRVVLYYKNLVKIDGGGIMRKLTDSLAELLFNFPMITGRLGKMPEGHWIIKCNDAGVRFVEGEAEGNVEEWLRNVNREKELQLVHWEEMFHKPYFWSPLYIQNTEFKEGGLAIGLMSCSHLFADPICATMFLKAWTETTLGQTMTSPPFFHPLPPRRHANTNQTHRHHHELISRYKKLISSSPAPEPQCVTTVTLQFSHQMATACVAMHQGLTLTPFEALVALFWVAISQVKGSKSGLINMSICSDTRKALGLDKGFFGNCMIHNKVNFPSPLDHNESKVLKAGTTIKNAAKKMDHEGIMDLVEWLEHNNHESALLTYNLKFDDDLGRPIRAWYYIEPVVGEGQLIILPSPESGEDDLSRRVVMVTLPVYEAVKLCEEAVLMKFCPTIWMDGL
ncbi:hypothetical protein DCAR_0208678 [Daucus carota subsp. sativus]|uniref:Uncharacterized protein n=1 Tax=Daucus carota subsp. sativus TaxID=79200 RepID=A0AAF0WJX9_DAUCS|nr:hypothetical protein DCAR_0208678 [Daucus carota subsp. sativus]